ncbi:MAG TPA: aldehyde dehydrogenase family protein [Polyangiales bacterium]|nr:aldehyde dehydrogenase family protein [Polyangiales bacterium]
MTIASEASVRPKSDKLEVRSPLTGELLATLPVHGGDDVNAAVARGRRAFEVWSALSFKERRAHLLDYRRELVRRMDEIVDITHRENGKTLADATQELLLVLNHLTHAANRAESLLKTRRVGSGLLANYRSKIVYQPFGVVGVIGPWNYPLHTPMGSISYALATGNAVVFKPSELTPLCGKILVDCAQAAIPIPDLLQLITGYGETGAALARSKVDKIAFTGSAPTGRRVMAEAAHNLTPVVLELGGKGPAIVAADADLERAAKGVVFGAFMNSGQACISTERALVVDSVYDAFVAKVVELAKGLKVGSDEYAHYGAMTFDRQVDRVREHVSEALNNGARAVVGGLESIQGRFIEPIVLVDVAPRMKVMCEETFGPVLPILKVASVDEAIRIANDTPFGLGSSVFTKSDGEGLAERVKTGMTSVNAVAAYAAIPGLPFGGVGESGFGRIHGDEGMLEFVRVKAITNELMVAPGFAMQFGEPQKQLALLKQTIKAVYGGAALDNVTNVFRKLMGG